MRLAPCDYEAHQGLDKILEAFKEAEPDWQVIRTDLINYVVYIARYYQALTEDKSDLKFDQPFNLKLIKLQDVIYSQFLKDKNPVLLEILLSKSLPPLSQQQIHHHLSAPKVTIEENAATLIQRHWRSVQRFKLHTKIFGSFEQANSTRLVEVSIPSPVVNHNNASFWLKKEALSKKEMLSEKPLKEEKSVSKYTYCGFKSAFLLN